MSDELEDLIDLPPEDQMGPAMLRLNERQRRFVCALGVFGGDQTRAYQYAGYKNDNLRSSQASASRLSNTEEVQAAIREEAIRRINSASLLAASTIVELMSPAHNSDKRLRFAAAKDFLDRTGFNPKTEHTIVIKDERTTTDIMNSIRALFEENKDLLSPAQRQLMAPVIDGEFSEAPGVPDIDGIEDLF